MRACVYVRVGMPMYMFDHAEFREFLQLNSAACFCPDYFHAGSQGRGVAGSDTDKSVKKYLAICMEEKKHAL